MTTPGSTDEHTLPAPLTALTFPLLPLYTLKRSSNEVYDGAPRSRTSLTSSNDLLAELLELKDVVLPLEGLSRSQTSSTSSSDDDNIVELKRVTDDHKLSTAQKWENCMSPKWPSLKRCMNEYTKVILNSKHELQAMAARSAQSWMPTTRMKPGMCWSVTTPRWTSSRMICGVAIKKEKPVDRLRDMCCDLEDHQCVDKQRAEVSADYLPDYDKAITLHVLHTKREAKQALEDMTLSDSKRSIHIHLIHLSSSVSWLQLCKHKHTGRLLGWPSWGEKLKGEWCA